MNPKISLQNHLKFTYKNENSKVYQLSAIIEIIERWNDGYDLMVEIDKNNKCICNPEMHWIHKLQCPEKVYKEGYEFKRLYEILVFSSNVAKINKECSNLYDEYLGCIQNPAQFVEWEQRLQQFVNVNKSIFDTIWFKLIFRYQDGNKLSSAEPFLSDNFDFVIKISPDEFHGVSSLFGLLYSDYPQHIKI